MQGYLPTNHPDQLTPADKARLEKLLRFINKDLGYSISNVCLLYTSDAADE